MSFFDKLGKTISDTTHSVVEKTKSSTDTIRLNGLISDEERLINAAYLNMGKKYAELHSGDAEPEFQEFLSAIAASQEKISGYREQIRKNKHLLVCQSCGAEIPETVLFCTKCGAENPVGKRLAEERAAKEAAERAQREAEAAARQAAAQQNAQPQYTYTQPPVSGEVCPSCGKPRTAGAMFCTFCGSRFVSAEPTAPAAPVTPAEPVPAPAAPGNACRSAHRAGSDLCAGRDAGSSGDCGKHSHTGGRTHSVCRSGSTRQNLSDLRQARSGRQPFLYLLRRKGRRRDPGSACCTVSGSGKCSTGCSGGRAHLPDLRQPGSAAE